MLHVLYLELCYGRNVRISFDKACTHTRIYTHTRIHTQYTIILKLCLVDQSSEFT